MSPRIDCSFRESKHARIRVERAVCMRWERSACIVYRGTPDAHREQRCGRESYSYSCSSRGSSSNVACVRARTHAVRIHLLLLLRFTCAQPPQPRVQREKGALIAKQNLNRNKSKQSDSDVDFPTSPITLLTPSIPTTRQPRDVWRMTASPPSLGGGCSWHGD